MLNPEDLRGTAQKLLFGLMGGRKIHEFIAMAWRKKIDIINDPLLSAIVGCLSASHYQELKRQTRIFIEDSANLIGVIDSTGTLAPDEVFIKIKKDNFSSRKRQVSDQFITQILDEILQH